MIGLVIFAVGVGAIVAVMPRFGVELAGPANPGPARRRGNPATTSVRLVAVLVLAAAVVVATGNQALAAFDPVANAAGEPRLSSFLVNPASPTGWRATFEAEMTRSRTLFGASSRWFRYLYVPTASAAAARGALPVTADIVDESGLGGFQSYGVTACYSFHGYTLHQIGSVDLGNGVNGQTLSYSGSRADQNWSIVWWIVPVRTGDGTRYERVILYLQNTKSGSLAGNRAFLVGFARHIVDGQRTHHDDDVRVTVAQPPDAARAAWLATADGDSRPTRDDRFWHAYFVKRKAHAASHKAQVKR